eukprot:scaffold1631_cov198-Pinguiococcus_pyrenoidosus.AAC.6
MISITKDGHVLKPYVILKGRSVEGFRNFRPPPPTQVVIQANEKAWMTRILFESWATKILYPYTNGRHAILPSGTSVGGEPTAQRVALPPGRICGAVRQNASAEDGTANCGAIQGCREDRSCL